MKIRLSLNSNSAGAAIKTLNAYGDELERKGREICRRLAAYGELLASSAFEGAQYDGDKDVSVTVEERGNGYAVIAGGQAVLFLEFGAGVTYGYGHPEPMGYGPGTYPPTDPNHPHWDDPNGWWTPGGQHTYGNAPSMAMYNAAKDMRAEIERVAREVFAT